LFGHSSCTEVPSIAGAEPWADSALDMDVAQLAAAEDMLDIALPVVPGSCHRHWLAWRCYAAQPFHQRRQQRHADRLESQQ